MVTCRMCGEEKPLAAFYQRKDGRARPQCRPCISARNKARRPRGTPAAGGHPCEACGRPVPEKKIAGRPRKYCSDVCIKAANAAESKLRGRRYVLARYGLTEAEFDRLRLAQHDRCAVCAKKRALHVDHDHVTGHVRALLCGSCNRAIGLLADDPRIIRLAADYVERNRQIKLIAA